MRKRNKHISVWMTEQEYTHLKQQAARSGLGIDPFIRNLVRGVEIRAKTPDCYAGAVRHRKQRQSDCALGEKQGVCFTSGNP